jgi:hypothetical protein
MVNAHCSDDSSPAGADGCVVPARPPRGRSRAMSFGRNPHVAKAEAEELKARSAKDPRASELAWRDGARQWDRAAERETDDKHRLQYEERAAAARASADEARSTEPKPVDDLRAKLKPPTLPN